METTGIKSSYYYKVIEIPTLPDHSYEIDDMVIFLDEEKQEEIGQIAFVNKKSLHQENIVPGAGILRKATPHDLQKYEANQARNEEAFNVCQQKIEKYMLNMQMIKANYSFNGARINFVFTADARVDFRELVKDLAYRLKKQIHLQQIGPRDRAKRVVGFGKCGQQTCCTRYLTKFESITMDMVREQNLENRGSDKLSGLCGKLLCCLKYEVEEYKRLRRELPPVGSIIRSSEGQGRIINIDVINQKARIEIQGAGSKFIKISDIIEVIERSKYEGTT